jgi:AcrR family transcriptional regulator
MARPLSGEKRRSMLAAATTAVASLGTAASTAKIAKDAGVSEGLLFVYFPTKDELLTQLYQDLRADLRDAIMVDHPMEANVKDRLQHLWNTLIEWGAINPEKREAMRQLAVFRNIVEAKQKAELDACDDIQKMIERDLESGTLRKQPIAFLAATMEALAAMVFEMATKDSGKLDEYKRLGWEALWGAISCK